MFKSAAAKIAHNSTLPALAGNRDLRPLQDLITSEKAVLQSLQRLSSDLAKANECLRHWGGAEGDDLQDILASSATLLGHVSSAFAQMASHEASIREHMKAVRSMEEHLDELRRRRKAVSAKADTAEKRLSKMNPEHKNIYQQTELLNNLREQIRSLDWDILSGEARLGDFKRSSTKNWMTLKFGGLLECAEKATIVAEMGKLVIEEIPLDLTQPGLTRKFYTGHEKTEKYVSEAQRCISEVIFDPQLVAPTEVARPLTLDDGRKSTSIDGLPSGGSLSSGAYAPGSGMRSSSGPGPTPTSDEFGNLGDHGVSRSYNTMPIAMPGGPIRIGDDSSRIGSTVGETGTSNYGSTISTPGSPSASRFSGKSTTFPARKASLPGVGLGSPPPAPQNLSLQPLDGGPAITSSFAAEVADALAYAERDTQPQPIPGKTSLDGPAPSYQTHEWAPSFTSNGLPRGAAPPTAEHNPWDNLSAPLPTVRVDQPSAVNAPQSPPSRHVRESEVTEDDEETQLPYASPPPIEHQLPSAPADHPSHRVHFGGGEPGQEVNGHGQPASATSPPTHERVPSPLPLNDEEAHNAAAREVAREMDMLTFSPPSGPPPGRIDERSPSPLQPPAPPFAQQQRISPPPDFSGTRSEGMYSASKTDLRSPAPTSNVEPPILQPANNISPSPNAGHQTRPSMTINVHSPSPSYSFNSTNTSTYGTPPEMPAAQPLRTGSPASPSIVAPGSRTISAAAFKRPGIRTPSGSQSPGETRPLPDVTPLALRKKRSAGAPSLPSSPNLGSLPNSQHEQGQSQENRAMQQDQRPGQSFDPRGPAPDYEGSYEVISSYSDPPGNPLQKTHSTGGGYEQGKFATNLDADGLR